jgi:hypothetical protein
LFLWFAATIPDFYHYCAMPRGFIEGNDCSTISPPALRAHQQFPGEEPMLELSPLFSRIKTMQERVGALRGYL